MGADPTEEAFRASPLFQELEQRAVGGEWESLESHAKRHHFVPRCTRVEGFLSVVESHAAPALVRLLEQREALEPGDRATLAFFFALLDARTPGAADRMAASSNAIMRMMFTTEFADTAKFAETYRTLFGEATDETIEQFRQDLLRSLEEGRVEFTDPRAQALGMTIQAAGAAAPIIYDMHWTLLLGPGAFVTSDRGLAMHDPEPQFPWSAQAWLSSPNVQITIPLSSDCCLFIGHGGAATEAAEATEAEADAVNLRTYGWAEQYIYGHSQELLARVRRLAKRRPTDVVRPIPHHQVLLLEADPSDRSLADEHVRRRWPP